MKRFRALQVRVYGTPNLFYVAKKNGFFHKKGSSRDFDLGFTISEIVVSIFFFFKSIIFFASTVSTVFAATIYI
jgi:hypothetical protein